MWEWKNSKTETGTPAIDKYIYSLSLTQYFDLVCKKWHGNHVLIMVQSHGIFVSTNITVNN